MNLEKHKAGVGLFVLGSLALLVAGIILLGGGKRLTSDTEYVLYFSSSVSGLSIGSPVMMRGVPLGTVTGISLMTDASNAGVITPVRIRINSDNLVLASGQHVSSEQAEQEIIREMISKGMRAQLQTPSLLTGQSRVQLDFYPDTEAKFLSPTPLLEIPTIASPIESLQKSLGKIPLDSLFHSLENSLLLINEFLASGTLQRTFKAVEGTFTTTNDLLKELGDAPKLAERILANLEKASVTMGNQAPGAMEDLREALREFGAASRALHDFASSSRTLVAPDSSLTNNLTRLLRDGAAAARSLRNFADTLDRNPESIIRGRQGAY